VVASAGNELQTNGTERKRTVYVFCSVVIVLAVGLIAYIWSQPWAHRVADDKLGMAAMPIAYLAIAGFASALRIVAAIRTREQESSESQVPGPEEESCPVWPIVLLSAVILLAAQVIWLVDPVVMCALLVLLLMRVARITDWRLLSGATIGTLVLLYVLFVRVLGVYFPTVWLP